MRFKKSARKCFYLLTIFFSFSGILFLFNNDLLEINWSNQLIIAPKYTKIHTNPLILFKPFSYKTWTNENIILPRGISIKEHSQIMELVNIAATIFARLRSEYMIISGSLLGYKKKKIPLKLKFTFSLG